MSVNAHRVEYKTIDGRLWSSRAKEATFNCGQDFKLKCFLENESVGGGLNDSGCGIFTVTIDSLKEAIDKADVLEISEEALVNLKKDVEILELSTSSIIDYDCL